MRHEQREEDRARAGEPEEFEPWAWREPGRGEGDLQEIRVLRGPSRLVRAVRGMERAKWAGGIRCRAKLREPASRPSEN